MSLATVIRLEFAYPGVGVLAGDSLQYLSVATAHGVIMVFYMIMPAIFGAFGNFLLPTQLGVHDVAFPRLNSAAFWFLPGGLIMLCQLVCTDRCYARMNCFNIRELQSILKNKFFTDLVNSHDHRDLLNQSMIGLRFKQNNSLNLDLDMTSFYKYGLHENNLNKYYNFKQSITSNQKLSLTIYDYSALQIFNLNFSSFYINFLQNFKLFSSELFNIVLSLSFPSFLSFNTIQMLAKSLSLNFSLLNIFNYDILTYSSATKNDNYNPTTGILNTSMNASKDSLNIYVEGSVSQRITRFNTVFINYDYKTGHYLGNWDSLYPFLMNSFVEVAKGIKKPC